MDFVLSILEQGLIYGILALGVYITYKILDFPDLTVDGSFPLGSAVTAALLTRDVNPYLSLFAAFLAGVLAGTCTGLIHVKGKVRDLLSGIIMMTALYTVNLMIAGSNNVPLFAQDTIFSNSFLEGVTGGNIPGYAVILLILLVSVVSKLLLDFYLKTRSGYLLRAVGDNELLVTSLAKDKGNVKILGLAISNGLVALSGSVFCQQQGVFDISSGTGSMVIGCQRYRGNQPLPGSQQDRSFPEKELYQGDHFCICGSYFIQGLHRSGHPVLRTSVHENDLSPVPAGCVTSHAGI